MFKEFIELNEKTILSQMDPPFLIAEIGLNHNNDVEIGKRTIEKAAKAGAHAVKFQTYRTENFICKNAENASGLFEIFKRYELSEEKHKIFQKTAQENGLIFFSTPLDVESVDFLVSLGVPALKVASGDLVNSELLGKVASTGLPLFVSTGASTLSEVIRAMEFLKDRQALSLCLMHCVSLYPTPPDKMNLRTLTLFQELTDGPVGLSDHSSGHTAAIMAVALGASAIEKHFTLDKNLPGPDHSISMEPDEFKTMAEQVHIAYEMRGEKKKILHKEEETSHYLGRRSLYIDNQGKVRSLRPNLHYKDPKFKEAWDYISYQNQEYPKEKHCVPLENPLD